MWGKELMGLGLVTRPWEKAGNPFRMGEMGVPFQTRHEMRSL